MEFQPISRCTEKFQEYICGLELDRVMVPTPSPINVISPSELPGGESLQARAAIVSGHDRVVARALKLIPPHAVVSATNSLGAHLSGRARILSFPYIEDAKWVAVDESRPGYADRLAPLPTAVQVAWLRRNPAWRIVFERDAVVVFHRVLPP